MERALSGSVSVVESHSPRALQDTFSLPTNRSPRSAPETIFDNLTNFPRWLVDSGSYFIDRLASEVEHQRLLNDPVFRGEEKVTGDGSPVVILPGVGMWMWEYDDPVTYFSKSDHPAEAYFPQVATLGHINILFEGEKKFIREKARDFHGKVHLIGHSLGGYFIRKMAHEEPEILQDCVKKVFIVGAPADVIVNTIVETLVLVSHLPFSARQIEDFVNGLRNLPEEIDLPGVDVYEIESEHDLIVRRRNGSASDNVVTFSSPHRALTRDPDVLKYITEKLAA